MVQARRLMLLPRRLALVGLLIVLVVVWENGRTWLGVPQYLLPAPSAIWANFVSKREMFIANTLITLRSGMIGFVAGNAIAVVLATMFLYSRTLERTLMPLVLAVRSVPLVAVTPLLVLWFGRGDLAKTVIVAIVCFFPMLVNMSQGLFNVNPAALELMDTLAASTWHVYWKIRFPSALPLFFAALRINGPSAVLGAVVAEFISTNQGLGFIMVNAAATFEYVTLWVAIALSTVFALSYFLLAAYFERRMVPWHESVRRRQGGTIEK
jgi:NitT/TauT family transport system permease protein